MRGREEIFITDEAWSVKATLFALVVGFTLRLFAFCFALFAVKSCSRNRKARTGQAQSNAKESSPTKCLQTFAFRISMFTRWS